MTRTPRAPRRLAFPTFLGLVVLGAWGGASPARAGRSVDEGAGAGKLVRAAARADLDEALAATGLGERCSPDALKTTDLVGIECRGALAAALLRARPVETPADVVARKALFADLTHTAAQVASWTPLSPRPGLGRARFDAHRALSRALLGLYDDLVAAQQREAVRTDVDAWLRAKPDPKTLGCQAARRSVELSVGGDATPEERGAAQALLTSHQCFLDESRLRVKPRPGVALKDSKDAALVAAQTSSEAAIKGYAASRSIDLERCGKHLDAAGKPRDAAKLEKCACGAVARWKLPAVAKPTTTVLPVGGLVGVTLDVAAGGVVARCGPLSTTPGAPGAP